ncbi:prolipoprotein diacylglyceryl transferase [Haloferula rosea]|uniref:Phosphatidylglycerol--prolipoprotein diacylglyceryl transferase n=1 Tax=Haloferula rosea TaxID=490093 RepID=A0A934R5E5_9BACT|nr:prolipoprotein diacylglyceryl transferase [Haloferula rosea]MBK1825629.1 prolipoprotein diacylglyceryl transferase [Haloferula rosea]
MSAPPVLATYVHDLNPVIFRINDAIALRWYGLAYLAAFLVGAYLLNVLSKRKLWVLPPGSAADFIAAAAIFGVFIGGRLGYMLWYYPRAHGWSWITEDPLLIFKVWEGGMASHGGILGLVVFTWFYARKKKVSWFGLGDGLCVVAPLGVMFGRLANFINGELYGRVAEGVAWAMKFPNTLFDEKMEEFDFRGTALAAAAEADPDLEARFAEWPDLPLGVQFEWMKEAQRSNPAISEAIAPLLEPRHPSQLYQAALEGLMLFVILWTVRVKFPKASHGLLTGLFFIFYAVFRIIGEAFREPDSKLVLNGMLTSGQFLSLFMIVGGGVFIAIAVKRGKAEAISGES